MQFVGNPLDDQATGDSHSLAHRCKSPAMPGDSPRLDHYDGRREFLISAKRKEIYDERVPEPESYGMGLQVPRGICTEATQEAGVRGVALALGRVVSRIGLTRRIEANAGWNM